MLRCKIPFGDYCLPPRIAVDTKADMEEIARNIGGSTEEHSRFREECKLAREFGCRLIILVENTEGISSIADVAAWKNPRRGVSPNTIDGPNLSRAMATIEKRYGCEFQFCNPEETGKIIREILEGHDDEG